MAYYLGAWAAWVGLWAWLVLAFRSIGDLESRSKLSAVGWPYSLGLRSKHILRLEGFDMCNSASVPRVAGPPN